MRTAGKFFLLLALMAAGVWLSLVFGGAARDDAGEAASFIFREIRIPKTITAILAGCSLSVAGLILQLVFRNPLAGPYVLGISSGAALMVALSVLAGNSLGIMSHYFAGRALTVMSAITGGIAVTMLILAVSRKVSNNVVLLLIGLMFAQVCGAFQSSLEYFAEPGSLKSFVIWGMGSLSSVTLADLPFYGGLVLICISAVMFFIKPLNAMLLGEEYARSAGINFVSARFSLILISSALTGITTAYCGPVAFVGIAVPILSRMIFHTSSQFVHLFSCMLLGSLLLLASDALAHSLKPGTSLPVNMITTFVGAPLVIYLMFRQKKW